MTRKLFGAVVLLACSLALVGGAYADTVSIGIQVGNGSIVNETSSNTGLATFGFPTSVTVGGFTIQSLVASDDGSTPPDFTVNGGLESGGPGTLKIYVTDQSIAATGPAVFDSAWGITQVPSGWTVTATTYVDSGNGLFTMTCATCTEVGTATFNGNGSSNAESPVLSLTAPFSETQVLTFTATKSAASLTSIVGGADLSIVPAGEPSFFALFALCLTSFAGRFRKRC